MARTLGSKNKPKIHTSKVGAYDIVNDVFYTVPTGYTTDKLIAGPSV